MPALTRRQPAMQDQLDQRDGDYLCPLAPISCTCFCAAMAVDYATLGERRPTGCSIRSRTGDTSGGTTLRQVDVVTTSMGVNLEVHTPTSISIVESRLRGGSAVLLQVWYKRIRDSKYRGSESFFSNHAVLLTDMDGDWVYAFDPIADGRRTGIYNGPGWYPKTLLWQAAYELNVSVSPATKYVALGAGKAYAAFTPQIALDLPPPPLKEDDLKAGDDFNFGWEKWVLDGKNTVYCLGGPRNPDGTTDSGLRLCAAGPGSQVMTVVNRSRLTKGVRVAQSDALWAEITRGVV